MFSHQFIQVLITHFDGLCLQSQSFLLTINEQVIYKNLGPTLQYFSTILKTIPNFSLFAHNFDTLTFFATVITTAKLCLSKKSDYLSKRFLFIYSRGIIFGYILVDYFIYQQNSVIFLSQKW